MDQKCKNNYINNRNNKNNNKKIKIVKLKKIWKCKPKNLKYKNCKWRAYKTKFNLEKINKKK